MMLARIHRVRGGQRGVMPSLPSFTWYNTVGGGRFTRELLQFESEDRFYLTCLSDLGTQAGAGMPCVWDSVGGSFFFWSILNNSMDDTKEI